MVFTQIRRILLVVASLSVLLFAVSGLASPESDAWKVQVDRNVQKHFQNQSAVGLVVGVVQGDETSVWSYGKRALDSSEVPTGDTFFEMGSITKTFTATLLALEILQGRVGLSDPVKKFWPELDSVFSGSITLEQLATHSSGLPRMPDQFIPSDPLNPYHDYDEEKLFDFLKRFKPEKSGPYSYVYSNVGVGLLGYLLSNKLNHENYEHYLRRNLLAPLGLNDTKVALSPSDFSRAAQGYGSFMELMPFWDLNVLEGAGVLKTTVNDLLKYVRFNMQPDSTLLSQAAELAHQSRAPTDIEGVRVGLVWDSTILGKHPVITHNGATGGYRANLIIDQKNRLGAVALANTAISPHCVLSPIFEADCEVPTWAVIDPKAQAKFLGSYHSDAMQMDIEVFFEKGFLAILPTQQPKLRLWAASEFEYKIPDAGVSITFKANDQGFLDQFTLVQLGKTFEFLKR